MKFINRNTELTSLNDRWVQKKPHFIIIYGKRRVGKTELIKQFIKDKPAIYFLADKRNISEQLKELGGIIGNFYRFFGFRPGLQRENERWRRNGKRTGCLCLYIFSIKN